MKQDFQNLKRKSTNSTKGDIVMKEIELVKIFGTLAALSSTLFLWGLIGQIFTNKKIKNTSGLSNKMVYSACIAYSFWAVYGFLKPDIFLIITQTSGAALAFVLLFQVFYYKKRG
jgi:uncharacterized protein with PQ loop repeat